MPAPVTLTAFAGVAPPWALADLDANFSLISALAANVNNYSTYLVDTGAADAYVVTLAAGTTCTLAAGLAIEFLSTNDNTGASTLNVNGTGIVAITNWDASALTAGQIQDGQVVRVVYDGTQYKLSNQFTGFLNSNLSIGAGKFTVAATTGATGIAGTLTAVKYGTVSGTTAALAFTAGEDVITTANYSVYLVMTRATTNTDAHGFALAYTDGAGTLRITMLAGVSSGGSVTSSGANKLTVTNGVNSAAQTWKWQAVQLVGMADF